MNIDSNQPGLPSLEYNQNFVNQSSNELVGHLNLKIFKVDLCPIKTKHNYKQCPHFHTEKDRRRNPE